MKYYELTAGEVHKLLIEKKATSEEITRAHIERIESVDKEIGSFIEKTFDLALNQAKEVDKRIASGEEIGILEGVPMAIKDNICTKDVKTTCASKMLENFVPFYDAFVVEKLKSAGAVVLGKLNMDEFAFGSSSETSYFGGVKNPYDLKKVAGGSSGGSAASVASDCAVYTLGSDTGGSVRQPAAFCGVVGLKPTYGRVSRYGLVAFASSLDQIGPITKNVSDCAAVLNVISGHDKKDSTSCDLPFEDFTKALVPDVVGMRIGVLSECLSDGVSDDIINAVKSAVKVFDSLGAKTEEYSTKALKYALPAYYIISSAEASSNLARFDGTRYGYRSEKSKTLDEMYKNTRCEGFGDEVKRRILMGTFVLSSGHYDEYYKKAERARTIIRNDFDEQFKKYDIIITPTTSTTAFGMGEKINSPTSMYYNDLFTVSANLAGLPAISVPCGFDKCGMPIGLQIIGKPFCESTVLRAAYALEQSKGC